MTPTYHVDPILDAAGYDTIRPGDGSAHGDIDAQPIATVYDPDAAALLAAAPDLRDALEHVDITLTNMLQVYSAHALSDTARAKVASERDRVRAVLARINGGAR